MKKSFFRKTSIFIMLAFILSNVFSLGILKANAAEAFADDLFFSEYIEGSSNNKAIEIYNGTGKDVDLSAYTVELYTNGAATLNNKVTLNGTLTNGDVYIIANSSAVAAIKDIADITSAVANFNGDDALLLKHGETIIDSFGQVGFDPGTAWSSGDNTTAEHTLVRKSAVTHGDTNASDPFDPSIEWDAYAQNTYDYLGSHTMDTSGGTPQKVADVIATPAPGAVYAGTQIALSTATAGAEIYYTTDGSDPNPGILYNAPVTINEALTIKAIAKKQDMDDSSINSFDYTIKALPDLETILSARQKSENTVVRVQGTVTRIKGSSIFIQDGTAGICIYQSGLPLIEGDSIEVTGKLKNFNGLLELVEVSTSVISNGNTVTSFDVTINQVGENLESQLIIVKNAAIGPIDTGGNTAITDSTGTINIYKVPELPGIVQGDTVDVTALVGEYNGTYQLTVVRAEDVTKSILGPDTEAPVITHTPVGTGNTGTDLTIGAAVTDNREVKEVKLYYRTIGQASYKSVAMPFSVSNYTEVIPKSELDILGLEYYIEAEDTSGNKSTAPADINNPYRVAITDQIINVTDVILDAETAEVNVNESIIINASILPENASNKNIIWSSEDITIASVNNGTVTGLKEGIVKITASAEENSNIKDECTITVKPQSGTIAIAEARTKAQGSYVTVSGVVTAILDSNKIYVQDNTAAIVMDIYGVANVPVIAQGDIIRFYGKLSNYRSLLTIVPEASKVEVISKGNPMPDPKVITVAQAADETYEAQLIRILNAVIGTINTNSNTSIADSTGTINIYKVPLLTGINANDNVNVTAIASQYSSNDQPGYQLRVRTSADVEKIQTPDTVKPVISHTPVTYGNIGKELQIKAQITDDREVKNVKLYYRIIGQDNYKTISMLLSNGEYSAEIPREDISTIGLEYYIEASDGINTTTVPEDITHPYQVTISDIDISEPEITDYSPKSGAYTGVNLRPVIYVKYTDLTGIKTDSIKFYINDIDLTSSAVITETELTYTPDSDLALGEKTVKVIISDKVVPVPNTREFIWNFYVGEKQYNLYFGQLHSHSNLSDGIGTPGEAYAWARDNAKADFFALTDHSNWFDNDKDSENITDVSQSTSTEWKQLNAIADSYNDPGRFVAIAGYEMTWSGSTGGWGHINTYNTPWFASRSNSSMDLKAYYSKLAQNPQSISQLNHPGKTFGDFSDFGYYTPEADAVVNLVEVGNGEGPVRGSGYFPSYEYYTRALDKGWHVAPTNNQDNHKGKWVNANEARTVILAPSLTRDEIYNAIREKRVYATEDRNLEIMYTVNGSIMGSVLKDPGSLNISIDIKDPDASDAVGKISIIANGGKVVETKTFSTNTAKWDLTLSPDYKYYYVRVDEADSDIAVTAPVWVGDITLYGLSGVEVSQNPQVVNTPVDVAATVYNNSAAAISNVKVEFFKNEISPENFIEEKTISSVPAASSGKAIITWIPAVTGNIKLYAQATFIVNGEQTISTVSTSIDVARAEDLVKVVIDGGHVNQYVTGDYAGKMLTLAAMMKDRNIMLVQNNDALTAEDLENTRVLIITDPQSKVKDALKPSNFTDDEVNVIRNFVQNGGSLIITSRADYDDKGITDPTLQSAVQGNRILEAIGSNLRFNDDEVIDKTSNGGQEYRLYFDSYTSNKYHLTDNIPEGQTYSAYSGCSVILKSNGNDEKVDWLVMGHDTTETLDSDLQNDATPVSKGQVKSIAAEVLSNGSRIIIAGTTFFSDFETAASDNAYSNKQIADNIITWLTEGKPAELKTISEVRTDADSNGVPDNLGKRFAIEGYVTAQSEAVTPKNAFFEVIYVQDETGGITVFGVSQTPLQLGTKVRVTGTVDQYGGDTEIQVSNESKDVNIISSDSILIAPKVFTTAESMLDSNEGWLVKVEGNITRMDAQNLYVDDGSGEARAYVEGYIGDGTGDESSKGKWDTAIKVGDKVSVIGLASEDPEGHRIRVRNTTEIVKISDGTVAVTGISLSSSKETLNVGQTVSLTASVEPENATNKNVMWASSDETIATVDNGTVTAIKAGTAKITAKTQDGDFTAECEITVVQPVSGISLDIIEKTLKVGETVSLTAVVSPENATNKNVMWASSDETIATVDNGTVTAIKAGTAKITAKTQDGDFTAECEITIIQPVTGISLDLSEKTLNVGQEVILTAAILPADATNKNVTWTSSDEAVASVTNGKVTAIKAGAAKITARTQDGRFEAECELTVVQPVSGVVLSKSSISLTEDRTYQLSAIVTPEDATNKTVYWTSSHPSVAAVNNTGRVTAISEGQAVITVTTADGGYTDSCLVNARALYYPPAYIHVNDVKLNKSEITIKVGGKETLNAIVNPGYADNKNAIWTTSNPSVAAVNNGVVTAISKGTAVITVKTEDGGLIATCTVTVIEDEVRVTGVSIDKETASLKVGENIVLKAQVMPENAKNKEVEWSSGNPEIAEIDGNGKATAIRSGTAVITVKTTEGGYTDTCTLTVSNAVVKPENKPEIIKKEVIVKVSKLNVRISPSTKSKIVGLVRFGQRFEYLGLENGWYKIRLNNNIAYVYAQYATYTESKLDNNPDTVQTQAQVVVTAKNGLNVRGKASISGRKLGLLKYGTRVIVIETINGWHKIIYNGGIGYISSQYVK